MTTLTIDDFTTLFKPSQLPDLGFFVDAALSKVTTATLLSIPDATIKAIGPSITAIRNAALSADLTVAGSPYFTDIKKVTDSYATIPTYISAYVKPTAPEVLSAGTSPGLTIMPYTSILTYIKKSIRDFDSIMLFKLVLQNANKTDTATITALTTLITTYIRYLNSIIATFKLDDRTFDKRYYRIVSEIEKTLAKMDIIVPSSKTLDITNFVPLVEPYIPPGATAAPAATSGPVLVEISKSIVRSINAFVTQNKLGEINNLKTIKAINTLPLLITRLVKHFLDNQKLLTSFGALSVITEEIVKIFPIPDTTEILFTTLTLKNFVENLKKPTVGIIPFITTNYMGNFALVCIKKVIDKSKNATGQTKISASSFVNKVLEYYIALLNTLINIFSITVTADTLITPHLNIITSILANSEYKLGLTPEPLAGGRLNTRRKRRRAKRRARSRR